MKELGYWIETSDYLTTAYGSIDYVKCDKCGAEVLDTFDTELNYCPVCGQKKWAERKPKGEGE